MVKRRASRSLNAIRALADPVIALLKNLVTQASEEDEEGVVMEGEQAAAFSNVPASTLGRHGAPF